MHKILLIVLYLVCVTLYGKPTTKLNAIFIQKIKFYFMHDLMCNLKKTYKIGTTRIVKTEHYR